MTKPQTDDELREQLRRRIGVAKYGPKYFDYIEAPEGTLGGKYPNPIAIKELDHILDDVMQLIQAHELKILKSIRLDPGKFTTSSYGLWVDYEITRLITELESKKKARSILVPFVL